MIRKEELSDYYGIRDRMRTGDLLSWDSDSLVGYMIQEFSKSDVNHSGMVIRFPTFDKHRVFIIEALEHGVVLFPLTERLMGHQGKVYWHRLDHRFDLHRKTVAMKALSVVGTKYDYVSLFEQIFARVEVDPKRFFCSEFVFWAWKEGGVPVPEVKHAPRPGDLQKFDEIQPRVLIYNSAKRALKPQMSATLQPQF